MSVAALRPVNTPVIKVTRTREYGASVRLVGSNFDEAFEACKEEVDRTGGLLVHPFDDPAVIAGQGTMGLEIMEQVEVRYHKQYELWWQACV
jgi:threonine dehydratase